MTLGAAAQRPTAALRVAQIQPEIKAVLVIRALLGRQPRITGDHS